MMFHNSNGNDYEIIAKGNDKHGTPCMLLKSSRGDWIAAWCCEGDHGSWGQGHYFNKDEVSAREYFANNYFNAERRTDED